MNMLTYVSDKHYVKPIVLRLSSSSLTGGPRTTNEYYYLEKIKRTDNITYYTTSRIILSNHLRNRIRKPHSITAAMFNTHRTAIRLYYIQNGKPSYTACRSTKKKNNNNNKETFSTNSLSNEWRAIRRRYDFWFRNVGKKTKRRVQYDQYIIVC